MKNKFTISIPSNKNIKILDTLKNVNKDDWNILIGNNNPFLEYDFLFGMEESNCVGKNTGWLPLYILYYEDDLLLGAIPAYLKTNSYGEYIFDWSWANFFSQYGANYYPKLLVAVPFTPATGNRILINPNSEYKKVANFLVDTLVELATINKLSSVHFLFDTKDEQDFLKNKGFMSRYTHQFHWKNNNYHTFDDFLAEFNSKKRNQIRRERRQANEELIIEVIEGKDLTDIHWDTMFDLYMSTSSKKWGSPYLNKKYFYYLKEHFKDFSLMVLAKNLEGKYIAGALNFKKGNHLYGRYWGTLEERACLHFEICYYQSIEYAIKNNIVLFEAGAQGEHKLARGFLPNYTYSSHLILEKEFALPIEDFLIREKSSTDMVINNYMEESPFKKSI